MVGEPGFEEFVTDFSGILVVLIGLVGLAESLLQFSLLGEQLPLVKGSMVSFFAVGFGLVLLTEDASTAFGKFKNWCFNRF